MRPTPSIVLISIIGLSISACSPEVGSEAWCKKMDALPKGDWTMNDAKEYTKSCIFKMENSEEP